MFTYGAMAYDTALLSVAMLSDIYEVGYRYVNAFAIFERQYVCFQS